MTAVARVHPTDIESRPCLAAELERLSAENRDWLMAALIRRLEQIASAGQDLHSGFAYDSQVDGGAAVSACLQGGA